MAEVRRLQPQFPTLARQREADHFGMLIFLTTEVLIFGGLFAALFVLRAEHSAEYAKAMALRAGKSDMDLAIVPGYDGQQPADVV